MADVSNIEWTDSTFNPWIGCTKVGPGCDHCYAEAREDKRLHRVKWGAGSPRIRTSPGNWEKPKRWNEQPFYTCACGYRGTMTSDDLHGVHGCGLKFKLTRRRVFCASLADVFDNEVDPAWRVDLLELIAATPNLDWLLLTKRIGNARRLLDEALDVMSHGLTRWEDCPWPNVWLGATVVNQEEADRDIPKLLATPASMRFLSIEPMLGPIEVDEWLHDSDCMFLDGVCTCAEPREARIDWVIAGGESGPRARPVHPSWIRSVRDQCLNASVPFLFKQWGGQRKKESGRLLDGSEYNGFPATQRGARIL